MNALEHSSLLPSAPPIHSFTFILIPELSLGHLCQDRGVCLLKHIHGEIWDQGRSSHMQHPTNPTYHARDPCQPQNIFHIPQSRAGNNPEQIADTSKICGEKERSSLTQHKVVCMSPAYVAKTLGELGQMTRTTVLQMKWSSCLGQSRSFTGSYVQLPTAPSRAEPHCRGRSRLQTVEILICIQALGMKEGGGWREGRQALCDSNSHSFSYSTDKPSCPHPPPQRAVI